MLMMFRRSLATLVAFACIGVVPPATAAASVQATCTGRDSCLFVADQDYHAGDCTMFHGATWTLRPGSLEFHGIVTSSDDHDHWVMQVQLKDAQGVVSATVLNDSGGGDVFVKYLPDRRDQYAWDAFGHFDRAKYDGIQSIQVWNQC
ncbi:hypothetical protein D5S17_27745 [Pseudonocardiaceae bacterium YIM PH 21723]|nr:hypothetical protein D5S17_27745 [Pseudonocardiaceae bacterium YIM PH 21723]